MNACNSGHTQIWFLEPTDQCPLCSSGEKRVDLERAVEALTTDVIVLNNRIEALEKKPQ